jgi:co-chaperonin GroES (HSP10)
MILNINHQHLVVTRSSWQPLPHHQMEAARRCIFPLSGVVAIAPQPDYESGLVLAQVEDDRDDHTNRIINRNWREQYTGTIVAINEEPGRDFMGLEPGARVLFRRNKTSEYQNYATMSLDDWAFSADTLCFGGRANRLTTYETNARIRLVPDQIKLNDIIMATIETTPDNLIPTGIPFIRPLNDWVLLMREPLVEKSAGGLFLTENMHRRRTEGFVIAQGPACTGDLQLGDRIEYQHESQETIYTGIPGLSSRVVLVREKAILAVTSRKHVDPLAYWAEGHGTSKETHTVTA